MGEKHQNKIFKRLFSRFVSFCPTPACCSFFKFGDPAATYQHIHNFNAHRLDLFADYDIPSSCFYPCHKEIFRYFKR